MSHPFEEPRPSAADQYGDPSDGGPHQYQPERPQGQAGGWTNDAQLEPAPIVTHAPRPDAGPAVWDGPSVSTQPEPAPVASPDEEAVAAPRRSLSGDWSAHQNAGAPAQNAPVAAEPAPASSPWARPDDAAAQPVEPSPSHVAAEPSGQPEAPAPEQPSWAGAGTPTAAGYAEQDPVGHTPPPGWGVDAPGDDADDESPQQAEPAQHAPSEQQWSNPAAPQQDAQPWQQPPAAPQQDAQPWQQPPAAPQQDAQPWQQAASGPASPEADSRQDVDRPEAAPAWGSPSAPGPDDGPQPPSTVGEDDQATQLTPLTPEPEPEQEPTDESLTIGRGRDNAMVLDDMLVSRQHVRISVDDEGLVIEDLGSRNGTFVNGRRIERTHLNEGDRIGIGASTFEVRDGWLVAITS